MWATCPADAQSRPADRDILRSAETQAAARFRPSPDDDAFLERVQRGCFDYFWKEVGQPAQLARDRKKAPVASIAAVGFQLAALPIGVERGWVTRDAARQRAERVLQSLAARKDNRKFGVFLHFPDMNTGGLSHEGFEITASTVDHALFLSGAIVASSYFGGDVAKMCDALIAETDWRAFAVAPGGFLSMGWKPDDPAKLDGPGKFIEWHWYLASDEERLIYLLAAGGPVEARSVAPELYYRLRRTIQQHQQMPPYVVSWPGTLFTYFFSHCYVDYRALGVDDPAALGVDAPRVDWFENSRRAVLTHRQRCIEQAGRFKTLSPERWGLSACAARDGYIVPQVKPNLSDQDEWFEGTIAPYAAGSAVVFTPQESIAALRAFAALRDAEGKPLAWRDPSEGGYGFVDSFNLDQKFASDDYTGIDQGPMLLAIENLRSGLVWKLFMQHESVRRGLTRLRLRNPGGE